MPVEFLQQIIKELLKTHNLPLYKNGQAGWNIIISDRNNSSGMVTTHRPYAKNPARKFFILIPKNYKKNFISAFSTVVHKFSHMLRRSNMEKFNLPRGLLFFAPGRDRQLSEYFSIMSEKIFQKQILGFTINEDANLSYFLTLLKLKNQGTCLEAVWMFFLSRLEYKRIELESLANEKEIKKKIADIFLYSWDRVERFFRFFDYHTFEKIKKGSYLNLTTLSYISTDVLRYILTPQNLEKNKTLKILCLTFINLHTYPFVKVFENTEEKELKELDMEKIKIIFEKYRQKFSKNKKKQNETIVVSAYSFYSCFNSTRNF